MPYLATVSPLPSGAMRPVPGARRAGVCVVDADPAFGEFVRRSLADRCDVIVFSDGDAALRALRDGAARLVFASAELPRHQGRSWVARLREELGERGPPVVLVGRAEGAAGASAPVADADIDEADDYCEKPLAPRELLARVRTHLRQARARHEAEARVRESEERFRHVAEHSPFIFWLCESDGSCSFLNERWFEFTGQGRDQALGQGWMDAVHPEDREQVRADFEALVRNRDCGRLHYRLRRHDGVYRWMLDSVSPRFLHGTYNGCVGSVIDITDEREERESLERGRRHLEMALRAGRIGTFEWDIPSGQVRCSPELEVLYGLEPGELKKTYRAWLLRLAPEDALELDARLQACFLRRAEEFSQEFRVVLPSGERRWFEGKWRCTYSPRGRPRRMAGIQIDIDERKRADLDLRFLNRLSESLFGLSGPGEMLAAAASALGAHLDVAECGFFTMGEGGAAASARRELRWTPEGVDATPAEARWDEAARRGADPLRVAHRDGEGAWLIAPFGREGRWMASLRVLAAGPRVWNTAELVLVETVLARVWPLVERARSEQAVAAAERKIHESEERMRATIEAARLGTWSYDPEADRTLWNERGRELLGLPEGGGSDFATFLRAVFAGDRERVEDAVRLALRPGASGVYDQEFRVGDGSRWLRACGRVYFEGARPRRFLGTTVDITELVKARETLRERRAELERLVAERTARLQETIAELEGFSYSISHDLRAPLRAMTSFGELLAEECGERLGAGGQDYLRRIIAAARRMDRLTQDVLVYSRTSRMELPLLPVDLQALIEGILESYPQFHPSRADIVVRGRLPRVRGNEAALVQCVSNLLGNAVKFIAPGVRPRVVIEADEAAGRARLHVQDNGIGVAEEAREKIFGIFERFHTGYEGTGIGLAVVRRAAERMGGGVSFTSVPGQGSRFTLEIPLAS
jgi:PAS domain S-box-containing protein